MTRSCHTFLSSHGNAEMMTKTVAKGSPDGDKGAVTPYLQGDFFQSISGTGVLQSLIWY